MPRVLITSPEQRWLLEQLKKAGLDVQPTSGTRTREQQERLYALYQQGKGALAAPPGRSKHEEGLALDFPYSSRLEQKLREIEKATKGAVKVLVETSPKGGRHIHVSLARGIHQGFPQLPVSAFTVEAGKPQQMLVGLGQRVDERGKIERLRKGVPMKALLELGVNAWNLPLTRAGTVEWDRVPENIKKQFEPYIAPPPKDKATLINAFKNLQLSPDIYAQYRMKELGFKHLTATHLLNLSQPLVPVIVDKKPIHPLTLLQRGRQSAETLLKELRDFQNYILKTDIHRWAELPRDERNRFLSRAALVYILARPDNLRALRSVNPELAEQISVTVQDLERRLQSKPMRALGRLAEVASSFMMGVVSGTGLMPEFLRATGGELPTEVPGFPVARGTVGKIAATLGSLVGMAPLITYAGGAGRLATQKVATEVFKLRLARMPFSQELAQSVQSLAPVLARTWMARTFAGRVTTGAAVGATLGTEQAAILAGQSRVLKELGERPINAREALGIIFTNAAFFAAAGGARKVLEPLNTYLKRVGWRFVNYLADKGLLTEKGHDFMRFQVVPRIASALTEAPAFTAAAAIVHGFDEVWDPEKFGHNFALGALFGFLFPEGLRGRADLIAAREPTRFRTLRQNLEPLANEIINASIPQGSRQVNSVHLIRNFLTSMHIRNLSMDEGAVLWDLIQERMGQPTGHWVANLITRATFDELFQIANLFWQIGRQTARGEPPGPPRIEIPRALPPAPPGAPPEEPPPPRPTEPPAPPTAPPEAPRPPEPEAPRPTPPEVPTPTAPEIRPEERPEVKVEEMARELLPPDSWFHRPGAPQLPQLERLDPADAELVVRDYVSRRQQRPANAQVVSRDLFDLYGEGVLKGKVRDRARLADFIFFNWDWLQAQRLKDAQAARTPTPAAPAPSWETFKPLNRRPIPGREPEEVAPLTMLLPPLSDTDVAGVPRDFWDFLAQLQANPPKPVFRYKDRDVVIINVPGVGPRAFYRSTGRNSLLPGRWFPVVGFTETLFIKPKEPGSGHPLHRYGGVRMRLIGDVLTHSDIPPADVEVRSHEEAQRILDQYGVPSDRDIEPPLTALPERPAPPTEVPAPTPAAPSVGAPTALPEQAFPVIATINHTERPPAGLRRRIVESLFPEVYTAAEQEKRDPERIEPLEKLQTENRVILEHEAVKPENAPNVVQQAREAGYEAVAVRYDHPKFGTRYHIFVYHPDLEEVARRAIDLRTADIAGADLSIAEHVELGRYMAQDVREFVSEIRRAAQEQGLTDIVAEADSVINELIAEENEEEAARQALDAELFHFFREMVRSVIPGFVHETETERMLDYVLVSEAGKAWQESETGRFIGPVVAERSELERLIDPALIDEALERAASKPQFRYAYRADVRPDGSVIGNILRPDEMPDRVPLDALFFGLREIARERFGRDLDIPVETVWSMGARYRRPTPAEEQPERVEEEVRVEAPPVEAPPTPTEERREVWRPVSRGEIKVGDYVRTTWKGQTFEGTVIAIDPDEWAKKTRGRFVAITIQTPEGQLVGMPWTDKATYERLEPIETIQPTEAPSPEIEAPTTAPPTEAPAREPTVLAKVRIPKEIPPLNVPAHRPDLEPEALHVYYYTNHWRQPDDLFSVAYASVVDYLAQKGTARLDKGTKAELAGVIADVIGERLGIDPGKVDVGYAHVNKILEVIRRLNPPVVEREQFRLRASAPVATLLWAIDALYHHPRGRRDYGVRIILNEERLNLLSRILFVDRDSLEQLLAIAPIFDRRVTIGTEGGFGRWIRLDQPIPVVREEPERGIIPTEVTEHVEPERRPPEPERPERERLPEPVPRVEEPEVLPELRHPEVREELPEPVSLPEGERRVGELRERPGGEVVEHRPPDVEERSTEMAGREYSVGVDSGGDRRRRIGYYGMTSEDVQFILNPKPSVKRSANLEAIRTLKTLLAENREPTDEELSKLIRYVSFGGIPSALKGNFKDELEKYLTEEEEASIIKALPNAHYTNPKVAQRLWDIVRALGFRGGKIVEPAMGVGFLIATAPSDILENSEVIGVEIEIIAAKIAQILFPKATILNQPFESVDIPDDSVDLFISNVPFGDYPVYDPRYPQRPSIHDYFFLKALDKTKPGGYVVFITSTFTLDKKDEGIRRAMAERGDLILAIRLPRGMHYDNALTQVVTDILVFRKRPAGVPYGAYGGEPFFEVAPFPNTDIPINEYFHRHPEHLFGKLQRTRGMYGPDEPTVVGDVDEAVSDAKWEPILQLLREKAAIRPAPVQTLVAEAPPTVEVPPVETPPVAEAPIEESKPVVKPILSKDEFIKMSLRQGSYFVAPDGTIRKVGEEQPVDLGKSPHVVARNKDILTRLIQLRDQLKYVIYLQEQDVPDEILNEELRQLNEIYDAYRAKYGTITKSRSIAKQLFDDDPDFPLLGSLELQDPEEPDNESKIQKADIFFKRVLTPIREPDRVSVDDPKQAIVSVLAWRGRLDFDWLARKSGIPAEQWREFLWSEGLAFPNPETGEWEIREQYLSGNIYAKLRQAEEAAETEPRYQRNVEALRSVLPPRIPLDEIVLPPGSPMIPPELIKEFLSQLTGAYRVTVTYSPLVGTWDVSMPDWVNDRAEVQEWTGKFVDFEQFVTMTLNRQKIVVTRKDPETGKRYKDTQATSFVQEKQERFWEYFLDWMRQNRDKPYYADLIRQIEENYNMMVGGWVEPKYDGSGLVFPGMNPNIQLYPHQKDAVMRILLERKLLLAHEVGTGKTFTMIAAGMKLKQLGIIKKPMYVVPNPIMVTWRNEFKRLYPAARVLFIDPAEIGNDKELRKRLINMAATGDWDAVVVAESIFEQFIPPTFSALSEAINNELRALDAERRRILDLVKREENIKYLAKQINRMESQMQKYLDNAKRRLTKAMEESGILEFGRLGVDFLFVDEAHHFKNYPFATKLRNIRGLSTAHSKRAFEMEVRLIELEQKYGERRVVFATGTPISNTLAEVYHMLKFLVPERLRQAGLEHFDAFSSALYSIRTDIVQAIHGLGFSIVRRLDPANLPEIMKLFRSIADVKFTTDMPYIKVPKVKRITIPIQPSPRQIEKAHELQHRYENLHPLRLHEDNALKITHEGRQVALSPKLLDPDDEIGPKIERAVEEIYKVWEETKESRLTQVVFADRYRSPDRRFHLFREMITRLKAMGIPEEEMFDITQLKEEGEEAKRQQIFKAFNEGRIRILFGTTASLGEGVNIQQRLYALHHLDPTWKPAEMMQREGRIVRQGNQNEEVLIYYYPVQAPAIDAYMYDTLLYKADFIRRILKGEVTARNIEDPLSEHVLSYQELVAITTGDPRVKQYFELQRDIMKLNAEREGFLRAQENAKADLIQTEERLRSINERIAQLEPLESIYTQNKAANRVFTINGRVFTSLDDVKKVYPHNMPVTQFIAQVREFKVYGIDVQLQPYEVVSRVTVVGQEIVKETKLETAFQLGNEKGVSAATLTGNLLKSIQDFVDKVFTERLPHYRNQIIELRERISQLERLIQQRWEKEEEFKAKWEQFLQLTAELKGKEREVVVTEDEPPPADAEETYEGRDVDLPDEEPPRGWSSRRRGAVINPFDTLFRRWRQQRGKRRMKDATLKSAYEFLTKHIEFNPPSYPLLKLLRLKSAPYEPPTLFEQAFFAFVDHLYPVEKASKALSDYLAALKIPLPIERDPRLYLDDYHASGAMASIYLREKLFPLLDLVQGYGELGNFLAYLVALHAKELHEAGIETGIELAETQKILNEIEDHWTQKGIENEMSIAVETWVQINNNLLDMLVDEGIIPKEAADTAKMRWQYYVPFRRLMDDIATDFNIPPAARLDVRGQSVFLPIKGSERKILNPLEVFARKVYLTYHLINRNRPVRLFFEAIEQLREALIEQQVPEDDPMWLFVNMFQKVRPIIRTVERREEEIEEEMDEEEVIEGVKERVIERRIIIRIPTERIEHVHFYMNGRLQTYAVPDWIAVSFKGPQVYPEVLSAPLTVFSRLIRLGATGLRPSWWLRNIFRDLFFAYQTFPGLRLGVVFPQVFWRYIRFVLAKLARDPEVQKIEREFYASGAHLYTFLGEYMTGLEEYRRMLEKMKLIDKPTVVSLTERAGRFVLRTIESLENLGNKLESMTRQFIYKSALEAGFHPLVARRLAREVTINFRRIGGSAPWVVLLRFFPFVNARIQAMRTLYRSMLYQYAAPPSPPQPPQPPAGVQPTPPEPSKSERLEFAPHSIAFLAFLWKALTFVLIGLLAYLLNRNRKGFRQLPDWAFAYDVPFFIDEDRYVRLPMDDFQRLFATLGMLIGVVADGNGFDQAIEEGMQRSLLSSLIPFASPEDVTLAPARPFIELFTGRELFTRREIEPKWLAELPPHLRYTRRTLPVFIYFGRVLHVSPEKLQTIAESVFPAVRELATPPVKAAEAARRWLENIPPETEVPPVRAVPIFGGFFGRATELLPPTIEEAEQERIRRVLEAYRAGHPVLEERYRIRARLPEEITHRELERLRALKERQPERYEQAMSYFLVQTLRRIIGTAKANLPGSEKREQLRREFARLRMLLEERGWMKAGEWTPAGKRAFTDLVLSVAVPLWREIWDAPEERRYARLRGLFLQDKEQFKVMLWLGMLAAPNRVVSALRLWAQRDPATLREALAFVKATQAQTEATVR